jgi:ribonuclease Z
MSVRMFAFFLSVAVVIGGWVLTCAAYRLDGVAAGVRPLDPRRFETLTLVTVGTGGAWENPRRLGPALAIGHGDRVALVDAGRGSAEALRAAEVPLSQPGGVYLTSLLPENTLGLDDLLLNGWLGGRETPLRLTGPPGTARLAAGIEAAHADGIAARVQTLALPAEGARFEVHEVTEPVEGELAGLLVRSQPLAGGPVTALAWRFAGDGRAIVIAPVPWGGDALAEFARDANVLVREAAYVPTPREAEEAGVQVPPEQLARERALQTPFRSVGGVAQRAGVDTLVLVRLRPPPVFDFQITRIVAKRFDGRILIADDGDEITR